MPNTADDFIMALRAGRETHAPEAEPVVLQHDGDSVTLILDDGTSITLDREELRQRLEAA